MADEFENRAWGTDGEEFSVPEYVIETTTYDVGLPPPDWSLESQPEIQETEPAPPPTAHEAMMANAAQLGEVDEPEPVGPPVRWEPVGQVPIPEVDWRDP